MKAMFIPEQQSPNGVPVVERNLGVCASVAPRLDLPFCEHHLVLYVVSVAGEIFDSAFKTALLFICSIGFVPDRPLVCLAVASSAECSASPPEEWATECILTNPHRIARLARFQI